MFLNRPLRLFEKIHCDHYCRACPFVLDPVPTGDIFLDLSESGVLPAFRGYQAAQCRK